jgi:hypothetical protein
MSGFRVSPFFMTSLPFMVNETPFCRNGKKLSDPGDLRERKK